VVLGDVIRVSAQHPMTSQTPMKHDEYRTKVIEAQIRLMHDRGIWVKHIKSLQRCVRTERRWNVEYGTSPDRDRQS
jgi:hypothetical protein